MRFAHAHANNSRSPFDAQNGQTQSEGNYSPNDTLTSSYNSPPTNGNNQVDSSHYINVFGGMYDDINTKSGRDSTLDSDPGSPQVNQEEPAEKDCPLIYTVSQSGFSSDGKTAKIQYRFNSAVKKIQSNWISEGIVAQESKSSDGETINIKWNGPDKSPILDIRNDTRAEISGPDTDGAYTCTLSIELPKTRYTPSLVTAFTTCPGDTEHLLVTKFDNDNDCPVEADGEAAAKGKQIKQDYVSRAEPFLRKKKKDESDIMPDDVKQGGVGDCYLMSVLASFANTDNGREVIRNMISSSDAGKRKAKDEMFDVSFPAYEKTSIAVKNEFPFHPREDVSFQDSDGTTKSGYIDEHYHGAQQTNNRREIWPMLIEKALAILAGHQLSELSWDTPQNAYHLLTKKDMSSLLNPNATSGQNNLLTQIKTSKKEDESNQKETTFRVEDCVIGATKSTDFFINANFKPVEKKDGYFQNPKSPRIIVPDHDYSLLRIHVDTKSNLRTYDFRNPHGHDDLNGLTEEEVKFYFVDVLSGVIDAPAKKETTPADRAAP